MNIALIGYGKMGKEIEEIAFSRKHRIVLKVDTSNSATYFDELKNADVAIEFTTPQSAIKNIYTCFEAGIPVVVGTTGWLEKLEEVQKKCMEEKQTLFYTSNYSIGVNLFFKLNEFLAKQMKNYSGYNVSLEEIHHIHKLDSPSGTAISLANQVIREIDSKKEWVNRGEEDNSQLSITSKRIDEIPGTHSVKYNSDVDEIIISHISHNRKGFALGALMAAEWVIGKQGVFGMNDLLKF